MPMQEFRVSLTVAGSTEDDRLKAAYEAMKNMSFAEFVLQVDFDDLEDDETPEGIPADAYIRVEFDPEFAGGNYNKVGQFTYIPATERDIGAAFEKQEELPTSCIIHYSLDEWYTKEGESYPDE